MKKLLVLVCLVGLLSCVSNNRPTEVDCVNVLRQTYPTAEVYKASQYHDYIVVEGLTVRLINVSLTATGARIYRIEELPRYEKAK